MPRWSTLLGLAVAAPIVVQAQATAGRITGTVTAEGGRPLVGAAVAVVGTGRGALVGADGRFTIAGIPAGQYELTARLLGYTPITRRITIAAGGSLTENFTLQTVAVQLSGIVTVGYGTQSRRNVAGAVASIRTEDITQVVTANPIDAIKGRLPGVDIVNSSFEPGANANIRIRGTRSIQATNNPLFVVDGVPIEGDLRDFDQNSIESIEVLKDASAAAVYGSRGANGVLLVTTKKGRAGRTQFSFNSTYGASDILRKAELMNGEQFANFRRESYRASGYAECANYATNPGPCDQIALDAKMREALGAGVSTDWQDAILRSGNLSNNQLAASGGNENTRFRASVGYLDQQGITITQDYDAKTALVNVSHNFGKLLIQLGAQAANTNRNAGRGAGLWDEALFQPPLGRVRDENGALIFLPTDDPLRVNPISEAQNNTRILERTNILGTLTSSLELMKGLRLHVNFGPQYSSVSDGWFVGQNTRTNRGQGLPLAGLDQTMRRNFTLSNFLALDRDYGQNHQVQGTLLYELQNNRMEFDSASSRDLPYAHQLWYNLGSGQNQTVLSRLEESSLQSYMGRVNYTYRDRYTLTLTGRLDGSSVLAEGNKYAFFPAAAVAWQLGDEAFLENLNAISDLKVRLSYGRVGNSAIGPYQTQGQLDRAWYTFGTQNPTVPGYRPGSIPNPDLKWETTDKYNVGVDFGLWDQRVSGAIDAYRENTHDLLLPRALPYTSGYSTILENVGETRNTGIELSLSTVNISGWKGLDWATDFAFSANRNRIVALSSGMTADVGSSRWVGQPISVYYNWKYEGVWQQGEAAQAQAMGFKPGDIKVADLDGNGKIDGADRTFIGNHVNFPKWQGSINNRFRFREFDLSMLTTARWGYQVNSGFTLAYTNLAGRFNNLNVNYWTPENPSNEFPRPSLAGPGNYAGSMALLDGSHVRIRDITLGYRVPQRLAARLGSSQARLYLRAQDPFLFVKKGFNGWDPEGGFSSGDGNSTASQIDTGGPAFKTYLFGFDLTF